MGWAFSSTWCDAPLSSVPMIAASEARTVCRTLAVYVAALVERLAEGEPRAYERLREIVGNRVARITLDAETVAVRFDGGRLVVAESASDEPVDGEGRTDRVTTLRLLDGSLEVMEAIVQGRLEARGEVENLSRIFQAVEVLLDASTRVPSLPRLAGGYEADPCRPSRPPVREHPGEAALAARAAEHALLLRLDLLP
jgi:SCP-2 sterol transfer family